MLNKLNNLKLHMKNFHLINAYYPLFPPEPRQVRRRYGDWRSPAGQLFQQAKKEEHVLKEVPLLLLEVRPGRFDIFSEI